MKTQELTDDEFLNRVIIFSLIGLVVFGVILAFRIYMVTRPSYLQTLSSVTAKTTSSSSTNKTNINVQTVNVNSKDINSILNGNNSLDFAYGVLHDLNSYSFKNGGNDMYVESVKQVTRNVREHEVIIRDIQDKMNSNNVNTISELSSLTAKELVKNNELRDMILNRNNLGITMLYRIYKNDLICTVKISHT